MSHLLAVQAQELRSARLALRVRGSGVTNEAIDRALTDERSLIVAWLGRGTLHLVTPEDYPWLLTLTAPGRLTMNRRRLGEEGVPPDLADKAVLGHRGAAGRTRSAHSAPSWPTPWPPRASGSASRPPATCTCSRFFAGSRCGDR